MRWTGSTPALFSPQLPEYQQTVLCSKHQNLFISDIKNIEYIRARLFRFNSQQDVKAFNILRHCNFCAPFHGLFCQCKRNGYNVEGFIKTIKHTVGANYWWRANVCL